MKKTVAFFILNISRIIPPRSAATGLLIGLAAMLTTTTTSCEPQVMCYDPVQPDSIPQDTIDSARINPQPEMIYETEQDHTSPHRL